MNKKLEVNNNEEIVELKRAAVLRLETVGLLLAANARRKMILLITGFTKGNQSKNTAIEGEEGMFDTYYKYTPEFVFLRPLGTSFARDIFNHFSSHPSTGGSISRLAVL